MSVGIERAGSIPRAAAVWKYQSTANVLSMDRYFGALEIIRRVQAMLAAIEDSFQRVRQATKFPLDRVAIRACGQNRCNRVLSANH